MEKLWHNRQGQTYADFVLCSGKFLHVDQNSKRCFLSFSVPLSPSLFPSPSLLCVCVYDSRRKSKILDTYNYNIYPFKISKIIVKMCFTKAKPYLISVSSFIHQKVIHMPKISENGLPKGQTCLGKLILVRVNFFTCMTSNT